MQHEISGWKAGGMGMLMLGTQQTFIRSTENVMMQDEIPVSDDWNGLAMYNDPNIQLEWQELQLLVINAIFLTAKQMINVEELWQEPAHSEAPGSRQDQPSKRLRWHEVQETEDVGDPPMAGQLRHFDRVSFGNIIKIQHVYRQIVKYAHIYIYTYTNISLLCVYIQVALYIAHLEVAQNVQGLYNTYVSDLIILSEKNCQHSVALESRLLLKV